MTRPLLLTIALLGMPIAPVYGQESARLAAQAAPQSSTSAIKTNGAAVTVEANDIDRYILDSIHTWVWSGFYTPSQVNEMIDDILEEDAHEDMLRAAVRPEFDKKFAEEKTWPKVTDFDRLDAVFAALAKRGIVCLHNAGYTMSDGRDDASEVIHRNPGKYWGFCFYHGQDVERAIQGAGVMLAFGDLDGKEDQLLKVAMTIKQEVERAGFAVEWNGTVDQRINIPKLDWKQRSPRR